jgi:hypothetical protein
MRYNTKNSVLVSSIDWTVPAEFKGCTGVLVAKAAADTIALYEPVSGLGWAQMTHRQWMQDYTTSFPEIPYTPNRAGWAIMPRVQRRNGGMMMNAIIPAGLVYALQDDVAGLRHFSRETSEITRFSYERVNIPFVPCKQVARVIHPALHAGCRPVVMLARC